jgi:uncharacterized protein YegL
MSDTLTAQQLANLLNLNVDTIRKRAKAGKIKGYQDKNGRWTFLSSDFPELSGNKPAPKAVEKKLTDVIFVLDRSGSMSGLHGKAKANLQSQIESIRKAADADNEYRISVINFDNSVSTTLHARDVNSVGSADNLYLHPNGSTRLNDAVLEAIRLTETLDTSRKQHAFLISVVTDGEENASNSTVYAVANQVKLKTSTDRYTFVYAGPRGSRGYALSMGIADGNATEWEQTAAGIQYLGAVSNTSLGAYTNSRSVGQTYSTSFYAQPVTPDANKFAGQLDSKLDDVSGQVKVERVTAADPIVIAKFCQKKFGNFPKGHIYYQLTESEKVQDYKKLIVQDTTTGNFFAGEKAKSLLGVPNFQGTVRLKPGSLGEFKVFVQSTSVNRKLTPGTAVVYLP